MNLEELFRGSVMNAIAKMDTLLDRKSAAKFLSVSPGTLAVWDCTKRYNLKPIKVGRAVRYRLSDLEDFLSERMKP